MLIAVSGFLSACASLGPGAPVAPASLLADQGRSFAERRCAGCHATGLDESPATTGPRFRDLGARYNALSLRQRFEEVSEHGSGMMPPIHIDPPDAEALVAYFDSLGRAGLSR